MDIRGLVILWLFRSWTLSHERHAQMQELSHLWGHLQDILPENICMKVWKLTKCPNFTFFGPKIFSRILGANAPISYAYHVMESLRILHLSNIIELTGEWCQQQS